MRENPWENWLETENCFDELVCRDIGFARIIGGRNREDTCFDTKQCPSEVNNEK
jgi:hypothetical protein